MNRLPIILASQEKNITGNQLNDDNVQNCSFAVVPPSDHPLVEFLEALQHVVAGVFGKILDPEFENDIKTFKERLMEAI